MSVVYCPILRGNNPDLIVGLETAEGFFLRIIASLENKIAQQMSRFHRREDTGGASANASGYRKLLLLFCTQQMQNKACIAELGAHY